MNRSRILGDSGIVDALLRNRLVVTPLLRSDQIRATIDLRLGTEFVLKKMDRITHLDPVRFHRLQQKNPQAVLKYYDLIKKVDPRDPFILHPKQFALGYTLEYVRLDSDIGGMLEGRSSWAREGLKVHSTAGNIHPGHNGFIVFELENGGSHPLPLYPGVRVAQLLLYELTHKVRAPYGSGDDKYTPDLGTNYGRPWEDWEYGRLREHLPRGVEPEED